MKKNLYLLVVGIILVLIGAFLKIQKIEFAQYVLILGLAIEAFALCSIVWLSLKNIK
jgi:hypothetical protein